MKKLLFVFALGMIMMSCGGFAKVDNNASANDTVQVDTVDSLSTDSILADSVNQ